MSQKNKKYLIIVFTAIIVSVFIGLGIDIEMKLYRLSQQAPVAVYISDTTYFVPESSVHMFQNNPDVQYFEEQTADTVASSSKMIEYYLTEDAPKNSFTEATEATSAASEYTAYSQIPSTTDTTSAFTAPDTTNSPETTIKTVDEDQNFYRTATGSKYHKSDCSYLSKSKIKITVEEIIAGGYEPCSRCMKE